MNEEMPIKEFDNVPLRDAKPLYVPLSCRVLAECCDEAEEVVLVMVEKAA